MAGKGSYNDAQKQFVKDEVEKARAIGLEPNALAIANIYSERFEPKREPHEIAALIRLSFPTGRRGRPPATEPKRRGRPPKTESASRGKARKRSEVPSPVVQRGRSLTEAYEAAIVKLSGECVETVSRINIRRLGGKLAAAFPDPKNRFSYNLLRSVLRRHGAIDAVARGERPVARGKMPEDLLGRIKAERCRIANELDAIHEEEERLRLKRQYLLRRYDLLHDYARGLEALEAHGEAASAPAGALALDPGPDFPTHPPDDAGFGYRDPGGHA